MSEASAQERARNMRKKSKEHLFSYSPTNTPLHWSLAVYILSPVFDGLWRENRGSVNRLTDFLPNQLLPKNINDLSLLCGGDFQPHARQRNRSCFTDVHFWTWIDANMGRKMNVCIFCSFITQIGFFVIPEICLTASVIHSKLNLITNIKRLTLWWL